MPIYAAPLNDLDFVLHDVLGISNADIPGYSDLDRDTTGAVLAEAGRIAAEVLAPLNATGDRQGCRFENGVVTTPEGFGAAYRAMQTGGWMALDCDPEFGGQGMPYLLHTAVGEMFVAANMAFMMYQGLTHGAVSALQVHGTPTQKAAYLPRMIAGDWSGTMNLTEPQCGTDLGLIRSRAEPQPDGSYRITGQKIFISSGEHDLAANIIHLVLARAPGGGEGTRGLSLFIVPKFLVSPDGTAGARNGVACTRIERKMGIHANATCEMTYEGAAGHLLGDLHKGMRAMFTMMNEARLLVGLQGYAQAEAAYQNAATYARDRLQGRATGGDVQNPARAANAAQDHTTPADPLIVHPDIRRSLMDQRSFVQGARALTLWGAQLIDRAQRCDDREAEALISLLTPVIKGFLTDKGFDATVAAQQVFGGHGYIEDWGVSQFVRDARIAMIYEGANGVQALDLVGRKLGADGGRAVLAFFAQIRAFVAQSAGDPRMAAFAGPLETALADLQGATMYFMARGVQNPADALAGATDYLHLFGHVGLGLMWARMAQAALRGTGDAAFDADKLITARHYMTRQLPATALHRARIEAGGETVMALAADRF